MEAMLSRRQTSGGGGMTMADDTPVTVLKLGDTLKPLALNESRIDAIASLLSVPRDARKRRYGLDDAEADIRFLASRLGVAPGDIRRARTDKRVLHKVLERASQAAVLLAPDLVYAAYRIGMDEENAPRDRLGAIKLGLEIAKLIGGEKGTQVNVQNNVAVGVQVNSQKDGGIMEDATIRAEIQQLKDSGFLDRFLALPAGSPETPPSS